LFVGARRQLKLARSRDAERVETALSTVRQSANEKSGIGSIAATRTLGDLLFGVSPTDLLTFAWVATLLTGVAILASYIPARRAVKVDPVTALK